MTFFAVLLFVALGIVAITGLGARVFSRRREFRAAAAIFWGVGLSWLANLNMWSAWHISGLRYAWVGVTVTGIALAGIALVVHGIVGALAGLHRKLEDEAERIERTDLRRIA